MEGRKGLAKVINLSQTTEPTPPRSLADMEVVKGTYYDLRLSLSATANHRLKSVSFPLDGELRLLDSGGPTKLYSVPYNVQYGSEEEDDLMRWLADLLTASSDVHSDVDGESEDSPSFRSMLSFPSTLSKQERAIWHKAAEKAGLHSLSEGFGEERHLTISFTPAVEQKAGRQGGRGSRIFGSTGRQGTFAQRQKAKKLWDWCQDEGGSFLNYSQTEILQILTTSPALPPELARLKAKRDMAKRLVEHLQKQNEDAAISLLEKDRSLAWIRDDDCGGYPLHVAAYQALPRVVAYILEQPSTAEQRDLLHNTPLQIAQRRKNEAIIQMLMNVGVKECEAGSGEERNPRHTADENATTGAGSPESRARSEEAAREEADASPQSAEDDRRRSAAAHQDRGQHASKARTAADAQREEWNSPVDVSGPVEEWPTAPTSREPTPPSASIRSPATASKPATAQGLTVDVSDASPKMQESLLMTIRLSTGSNMVPGACESSRCAGASKAPIGETRAAAQTSPLVSFHNPAGSRLARDRHDMPEGSHIKSLHTRNGTSRPKDAMGGRNVSVEPDVLSASESAGSLCGADSPCARLGRGDVRSVRAARAEGPGTNDPTRASPAEEPPSAVRSSGSRDCFPPEIVLAPPAAAQRLPPAAPPRQPADRQSRFSLGPGTRATSRYSAGIREEGVLNLSASADKRVKVATTLGAAKDTFLDAFLEVDPALPAPNDKAAAVKQPAPTSRKTLSAKDVHSDNVLGDAGGCAQPPLLQSSSPMDVPGSGRFSGQPQAALGATLGRSTSHGNATSGPPTHVRELLDMTLGELAEQHSVRCTWRGTQIVISLEDAPPDDSRAASAECHDAAHASDDNSACVEAFRTAQTEMAAVMKEAAAVLREQLSELKRARAA